jgi:type VI secretion system secreted protein VgrG
MLADSKSSHIAKPGGAKLVYRPITGKQRRNMEHVYTWTAERRFNTGKIVLNDYDFWRPGASLLSEKVASASYQNAKLEKYDYPGRYKEKSLGDHFAKIRLEAEQAHDHRCQSTGDAVSVIPGYLVDLQEHPQSSQNRGYLTVSAAHSYVSDRYRTTGMIDASELYQGRYEFLPDDVPFRAPPISPKPVVYGPQTAKVVGEGEIDVDKDGCIMVQFHWDRKKQMSRRVRIAQVWSGKSWGGIFIPRVGQEVVVEFVEGDPDRPLVVGTVYNRDNQVPYPLPSKKTVAGLKSNSSEGGDGFNEFVFDDKKGSELVRLHAQKNMEAVIENDEARKIGHDITVKVGNVMTVEAGRKIELKVAASKIIIEPKGITIQAPTITIKADATLDATSPLTTVKGTAILTLKGGLVLIN